MDGEYSTLIDGVLLIRGWPIALRSGYGANRFGTLSAYFDLKNALHRASVSFFGFDGDSEWLDGNKKDFERTKGPMSNQWEYEMIWKKSTER